MCVCVFVCLCEQQQDRLEVMQDAWEGAEGRDGAKSSVLFGIAFVVFWGVACD